MFAVEGQWRKERPKGHGRSWWRSAWWLVLAGEMCFVGFSR